MHKKDSLLEGKEHLELTDTELENVYGGNSCGYGDDGDPDYYSFSRSSSSRDIEATSRGISILSQDPILNDLNILNF